MIRIPRLQQGQAIVDGQGRPNSYFVRQVNDSFSAIESTLNRIVDLTGIQDQFQQALTQAKQAVKDAQDAADEAQRQAEAQKREQALVSSYIEPNSVLTADTATISVAAHVRRYTDGTSANVAAGTVAVTASGDTDYVSYVDPERDGGTVSYRASTTAPVQGDDVHVVGAVVVPATGTAQGGAGPQRPGYVQAKVADDQ